MSNFLKSIQPILNEIINDLTGVTVRNFVENIFYYYYYYLYLDYR